MGIAVKEVNNALGGCIDVFKVPLAEKWDGKPLENSWVCEPKLDGARCIAFMPAGGGVRLFSRTGKEWKNFESVRVALEAINKQRTLFLGKDIVMDGEIVSLIDNKIDFQSLQQTLFNKKGVETGKLKFFAFDLVPMSHWQKGLTDTLYVDRIKRLQDFKNRIYSDTTGLSFKFDVVPYFTTVNPSANHIGDICRTFVKKGFEGAILRKSGAGIDMGRTNSLLKVKTLMDAEATVIGKIPGTGKYQHCMIGALECKTTKGVVFQIGSGLTDEQRRKFYKGFDIVGKVIVYKYQELTDSGAPRFPIFKGLRHKTDF